MDTSFLNDPVMKDIHPKKREILVQLAKDAEGKSLQKAIPYLMKANQELKANNMKFTQEEIGVIMALLTKDMNEEERQKVKMMVNSVNKNLKK